MYTTTSPIGNHIQDFKILSKIGSGGFATVYKARCLKPGYEDLDVAIKEINKENVQKKKLRNRVEQEIAIHSHLHDSSIVQFHTWFEDGNSIYLILELCDNGSLEDYLKERGPLCEDEAHDIIKQVIEGVRYLHSKFILHRDLSLRNILLTKNMIIKIADFGMAAQLSQPDEMKATMLGTANYMSPEIVTRDRHGFKTDCWGVGCIFYALLTGKPPFDSKGVVKTLTDVVMSNLKVPDYISHEAKELIYDLLKKNQRNRIDINATLQYPFFTKRKGRSGSLKSEFSYRKYCDSGVGSMSGSIGTVSSRSDHRSSGTVDSGLQLIDSSIRGMRSKSSYSVPCDVHHLETIHSSGCSYHSTENLSRCGTETKPILDLCTERVRRSIKPTTLKKSEDTSRSVRQLKNKIHTLPSRKEYHESHSGNICHNQERSPSKERRRQDCQKIHSVDSFLPRDMESPFHQREMCEDAQIRSNSKSPLPYPSHHLQNLCNDPLCSKSYVSCQSSSCKYSASFNKHDQNSSGNVCYDHSLKPISCSHDRYCFPEDLHCSHEKTCSCQRLQPPVVNCRETSFHSYTDHRIERKDFTKDIILENKSLKHVVVPLSTARILPKRHATKKAVVSINNNGQVCLEFLKVRRKKKCVASVCVISPDGMMIFLYKPKGNIPVSNETPPIPENPQEVKYFSYDNLPEIHWKKYLYAARFIDIVRAKTPKITIYGKHAKCIMMENSKDPDFEMTFYEGGKITKISSDTTLEDKNGICYKYNGTENLNGEYEFMWNEFVSMKKQCIKLEAHLESFGKDCNDSVESYFPVIIGRKPDAYFAALKDNNKENLSPSLRSSALNTAIDHMRSFDGTINTNCSPYENSSLKYHPKLQSSSLTGFSDEKPEAVLRNLTDILSSLKELPKLKKGKVCAEYKDGYQMWSTKEGRDVAFFDTHSKKWFYDIGVNPEFTKRIKFDLTGILLYILSEEKRMAS